MTNPAGRARAGHPQGAHPVPDVSVARRERGLLVGTGAYEPAREKRARLAPDQAERAFVSMIEQEELSMPALERLYAVLRETEATAAGIETRFLEETSP